MKTEVLLNEQQPTILIGNLNKTDHVGFILSNNTKGYIYAVTDKRIIAANSVNSDTRPQTPNSILGQLSYENMQQLFLNIENEISSTLKTIYRFDTRKELYKWLSED